MVLLHTVIFFIFSIKPGSLVIFAIFVHKKYRRLSELLELNESGVEEKNEKIEIEKNLRKSVGKTFFFKCDVSWIDKEQKKNSMYFMDFVKICGHCNAAKYNKKNEKSVLIYFEKFQ